MRRIGMVVVGMVGLMLVGVVGVEGIEKVVKEKEGEAGKKKGGEKVAKYIQDAIGHEKRPGGDKARDRGRKPGAVLMFSGVRPGMRVADMMAGGGYYTELLSRVVGKKGKVYAQNNGIANKRFAKRAMDRRLKGRDLGNVVRLDKELEDPGLPKGELDVVYMVLFYHDTYWMKVDREKMNKAILGALKPGGVFLVIDHEAKKGSGSADNQRLHRVEGVLVKKELLAAGFEFVGESRVLRRKGDDHTVNVFRMRGKTDRWVYKFRRPAKKEG